MPDRLPDRGLPRRRAPAAGLFGRRRRHVFKPVDPFILQSKVAVFVDLFRRRRDAPRGRAGAAACCEENFRVRTEKLHGRAGAAPQRGAPGGRSSSRCRSCSMRGEPSRGSRAAVRQRQCRARSAASRRRSSSTSRTSWSSRIHPEDRERVLQRVRAHCATRRAGDRVPLALRRRPVPRLPRPGRAGPRRTGPPQGDLRHVARRHRAPAAGAAARAGAEDGGGRPAHRRHRARFQQPADRRARQPRPPAAHAEQRRHRAAKRIEMALEGATALLRPDAAASRFRAASAAGTARRRPQQPGLWALRTWCGA